MNYRTYDDLSRLVHLGLHAFPRDADLVVGVPRSGLMMGSMVALALNLPLADVEGFLEGRVLKAGCTRRTAALDVTARETRKVILVDDSVNTGTSIATACQEIRESRPDVEITTLVAFARSTSQADVVLEVLDMPRVFQWNLFHHSQMENTCLDIDGVLCVDPEAVENDDGPAYERFLSTTLPLALPSRRVGTLVTSRLERYRARTEAWLSRYDVRYGSLVMLDLPDRHERVRLAAHVPHKAAAYVKSGASLFVESDPLQADGIAKATGLPVLCATNQVLYKGNIQSIRVIATAGRSLATTTVRDALIARLGVERYETLRKIVLGR